MYTLLSIGEKVFGAFTEVNGCRVSFVFSDPDNTDYQLFKRQIDAEKARLKNEHGVLMTPEQAKAYVATLP